MAAGGLLALLDDIAAVLDDVAVMSKVAAKKTAGIAGDDLAVGAGTVVGAEPAREIPVVWAVAKGSFINKLYLIPGALLLDFIAPFLIKPLLVLGGLYLCYEGAEKILHARRKGEGHKELTAAFLDSPEALLAFEKKKINEAIRTDLILSGEIVAITLGAVADKSFTVQVSVLCVIGLVMTVGIYGLVAGIVKLDDFGLYLSRKKAALVQRVGRCFVTAAPKIMKALSVVGTAAMILVGGELILHSTPAGHVLEDAGLLASLAASVAAGLVAGFLAIPVVTRLGPPLVKGCGLLKAKVLSMKPRKTSKGSE